MKTRRSSKKWKHIRGMGHAHFQITSDGEFTIAGRINRPEDVERFFIELSRAAKNEYEVEQAKHSLFYRGERDKSADAKSGLALDNICPQRLFDSPGFSSLSRRLEDIPAMGLKRGMNRNVQRESKNDLSKTIP